MKKICKKKIRKKMFFSYLKMILKNEKYLKVWQEKFIFKLARNQH